MRTRSQRHRGCKKIKFYSETLIAKHGSSHNIKQRIKLKRLTELPRPKVSSIKASKNKSISETTTRSEVSLLKKEINNLKTKLEEMSHLKTTNIDNQMSVSCLHSTQWSLSHVPFILHDETMGIKIKEIEKSHLNNKLTRELYEFNIASGHYYNLNPNKPTMKTIAKIWVIEYLPHNAVLKKFEATKSRLLQEKKQTGQ